MDENEKVYVFSTKKYERDGFHCKGLYSDIVGRPFLAGTNRTAVEFEGLLVAIDWCTCLSDLPSWRNTIKRSRIINSYPRVRCTIELD